MNLNRWALGIVSANLFLSAMVMADPAAIFENPAHDPWVPSLSANYREALDSSTSADTQPDLYHSFDVHSYNLTMEFNPVKGSLAGINIIQFSPVVDQLGTVILDAVDMDVQQVLWSDGSTLLTTYDQKQLKITLPFPLAKGAIATISVKFSSLRPQTLRTAAADTSRKDRVSSAYTYTEPDGSRRWFPSHDIPADKTVTTMRFIVPSGFSVVSNGDEGATERLPDGRLRFHFSTRMKIATYLTSVVLGPLSSESIGALREKPLTISAPNYLMPAFRRDTARTLQMMNAFERFTQTAYGFQKYRQALAEGYSGSMEHQSATTMGGRRIVGDLSGESVVAHELAHQWFGDLVTCGVWGDMWLNEGFASYLPQVFFTAVGEHDRVLLDYLGTRDWYLGSTTIKDARPLSTPEEWPNYDIFDQHSYAKGAMVIHLFRSIANSMKAPVNGIESFSTGLGIYLQEHAYGNGRYFDLQSALEKATGRAWQQLFKEWVLQKGHPDTRINWTWNETTRALILDVTQLQADASDPRKWGVFSFPLGIKTLDERGQTSMQWQWVTQAKQSFSIPAATRIIAVTVDPTLIVPGEFVVTQPALAFADAFNATTHPTEQAVILSELLHTYPSDADLGPAFRKMAAQATSPMSITLLALRVRGHKGLLSEARVILEKSRGKLFTLNQRGFIAALDAWIIKGLKPEERPAFLSLQNRWQSSLRVEERESYIDAMEAVDAKATQIFAIQELAKPTWTDRDRMALVKVIAAQTNEITKPFIMSMLKGVNTSNIGQVFFQGLESQKFKEADALPLLHRGALSHRDSGSRAAFVRLIAFQGAQKEQACAALKDIIDAQTNSGTPTDRSVVIPEAKKSAEKLGCAI